MLLHAVFSLFSVRRGTPSECSIVQIAIATAHNI